MTIPRENQQSARRHDNLTLAVVTIVFTVFALSLGDAVIKQISANFPLWQIFVLRSLLALPILLLALRVRRVPVSLIPVALWWTIARSLMLVTMWVAYYAALPFLTLSVAAAAYYTLPLFITLFAALFVGDRIGAKGWFAVGLGFCGIVLILRPDAEDFNAYALLPLFSAVLYALSMILTRTRCREEHPLILSLMLNGAFVLVGLVATSLISFEIVPNAGADADSNAFLLGPWIAMQASQWLAMALLAAAVLIGSVGAAIAYQIGTPSVVATFDFSYVAFATIWGFLFFAERPDPISIAGIVLIVVGGILALRR